MDLPGQGRDACSWKLLQACLNPKRLISCPGLSLEPTQQHAESSPHLGSLSGPEPGALAGFGDRKVIPGIPGYLEEKDLEISSAEGLILTPLFFS